MKEKLTKYPEGTTRELWNLSFPLMISSLASLFMIFVDRCFLAHYSIDALNAATNSGTLSWAFIGGMGMMTAMSEVFVAQFNGAKIYSKIRVPVWQMIWISLFSLFFLFIPLGLFGGPLFFKESLKELEITYFKPLMLAGFSYPLMMAISGFFIGRGKTKLLLYVAVAGNILNLILDKIFIFGLPGIIPEMGIFGAAIATCTGTFFELLILIFIFLKKEYRIEFGTNRWKPQGFLMKKCFRVGFPQGIFYSIEFFGWAFFYLMMTNLSEIHITVSSICQTAIILFSFFFDGLSRGVAALAGNYIGSKRYNLLKSLFRSGCYLQILFSSLIFILFLLNNKIFYYFLIPESSIASTSLDLLFFQKALNISLLIGFFYLFLDGIRWVLAGILVAAGDTIFLLISGGISVWLFLLLPLYFIVVKYRLSVISAWLLVAGFAFSLTIIYFIRYRSNKWKKISITEKE